MIKRYLISFFFLLCFSVVKSQTISVEELHKLKITLDSLETKIPALTKKVNSNINNVQLPTFIRTIADINKLNVSIEPNLRSVMVTHNFTNVTIKDALLFSAKKFNLNIGVLGSIITISKIKIPEPKPKELLITYNKNAKKLISLELKDDSLGAVLKKITELTGKNLFYPPSIAEKKVSIFLKDLPVVTALNLLAKINKLNITKSKNGLYTFSTIEGETMFNSKNRRSVKSKNFYFKVVDTIKRMIDVDINKVSIATVVNEIGLDLKVSMFTTAKLPETLTTSFKANNIHFDTLLNYIFETTTNYSYKKENDIYFFGKSNQASVRKTVVIPLVHRTIEIMEEKKNDINNNQFSYQNNYNNQNRLTGRNSSQYASNQYSRQNYNSSRNRQTNQNNSQTVTENLLNLIPEEVRDSLQITSDIEHNSFIVSGSSKRIERFRNFVKLIDKSVPVVTIDVMILEVSNSATVSTGITLGIGDKPATTKGGVYPNTNLTLGANSINKIIGGLNGFGSLNLGKVTPNFYAKIEALETNGDLDIKSTPKLTALNGHEANLSNGERSYYVETVTDIIGSQNPQTREIKNYIPVDANLAIKIRPIISGDGQITMSIKVIQSTFNGKKIDNEAPPGINSREFTSTIRVKDQDVVILGGLEENLKNDSGSGVPFLARIPIIKYLFSKRTRTASKTKLSVLIKPTIIQ